MTHRRDLGVSVDQPGRDKKLIENVESNEKLSVPPDVVHHGGFRGDTDGLNDRSARH